MQKTAHLWILEELNGRKGQDVCECCKDGGPLGGVKLSQYQNIFKSLKMGYLSVENEMGCPVRRSEMPITTDIQVKTVDMEFTDI